tara:strand:- start:3485 stop:4222 length:738 start_codon:yes stop_codon:yes gene_type:complete
MAYMNNAGMATYNGDFGTRNVMPSKDGTGIQRYEYFEDFDAETDATGAVLWTLNTLSSGTLTGVAEHGGVLDVNAGAATDDQGVESAQPDSVGQVLVAANRQIYCEIRAKRKLQSAGQFWGLAEVDAAAMGTANFEAKGIGFVCDAGTSAITALDTITTATASANSGEEVTADVATAMVNDDKYRVYGIDITGTGMVEFYIDGVLKATHTTNIPTGALVPTLCSVNSASAQSTLYVDYIYINATR